MTATFTYLEETYNDLVNNYAHPTTKYWFMVRSPIPALSLVIAYVIFVKIIGPKIMENRKPFQLKKAMIIYSAFQAVLSLYVFSMSTIYGWVARYNFICQPMVLDHPDEKVMLNIAWGFFMIRFLEFTDTVFFILRKKFNQVTNLHVVHHSLVPMIFWLGMLFVPTGHYTLAGYLNAFVHFFMYTYYMMAAMGPAYRKYLWWKKYMTILQLVQFTLVLLHAVNTVVSDCDVPKWMALIIIFQAVLFFSLFFNFYYNAFSKNKGTNATNLQNTEKFLDETFKKNNKLCEQRIGNNHSNGKVITSLQDEQFNGKLNGKNGLSNRKHYLDK